MSDDAGRHETGEKLDHTLRAYARLERRSAEKGREIDLLRKDNERLREALDWIYTEPEDALRVQTWARAALDGKPFEARGE